MAGVAPTTTFSSTKSDAYNPNYDNISINARGNIPSVNDANLTKYPPPAPSNSLYPKGLVYWRVSHKSELLTQSYVWKLGSTVVT